MFLANRLACRRGLDRYNDPMPGKRDSAYYRKRLRKDYPALYADLTRGKYRTVRAAAVAAGLIRPTSRVKSIKRDWTKATTAERREILEWLKKAAPGIPRRRTTLTTKSIVDADGRLLPAVIAFTNDWITKNKSKPGRIMKAMGFRAFDWRLAHALSSRGRLPADVIGELEKWLRRVGYSA